MPEMSAHRFHAFQICYSAATLAALPEGFVPLDHLQNERADWREYWPMRRYLLEHSLDEQELYGFFSPKFFYKTGQDHASIQRFIDERYEGQDVVAFCPFWDLAAIFRNVFEQGDFFHGGLLEVSQAFVDRVSTGIPLGTVFTHSQNTILCNYFLARPRFWRVWLDLGERLFKIAESADDPLGQKLRTNTSYGSETVQMKVFVMERLATLALLIQPEFRTLCLDPFSMPASATPFNAFRREAICSDALKLAYMQFGQASHFAAFAQLREDVIGRLRTS